MSWIEGSRYAADPYGWLVRAHRREGDVFTLRLPTGPVVVLGHPDGARAVFAADPATFEVWAKDAIVPVFGARSSFASTGEPWRRHRRAVVAALRDRDRGLEPIVSAHVEALVPGELDVGAFTLRVSLDVVVRALFGADGPALAPVLARFVARADDPLLIVPLLWPGLRRSWMPAWRSFVRAREAARDALRTLVAVRRTAPSDDATSVLLAHDLDDEEAVDELLTLLVAGHETTAHAAAWALHELVHAPAALERLVADDDPEWIDAVCEETLRLHPVVVPVTRQLARPLEACGRILPAGTAVSPSSCVIHRRADLFDDPDAFRPERFVARSYGPFEHLPFGGGPTRCPGAAWGKAEMGLVVGAILRRWSLAPTYAMPVRAIVRGLVMVPDRPLTMRIAPR